MNNKTSSNTKIATVPIGYADGVSRGLSNKIFGLINGKKVPQIGNITMDQMMFDVTNAENINIGGDVTIPEGKTIDEVESLVKIESLSTTNGAAGGIIGRIEDDTVTFTDCKNSGKLSATGSHKGETCGYDGKRKSTY